MKISMYDKIDVHVFAPGIRVEPGGGVFRPELPGYSSVPQFPSDYLRSYGKRLHALE
jgi:hypothetical protein